MKKIASVIGLGLALAFGGAAIANGGERGFNHGERGEHHMMKRLFSKLDLSEEQKEVIKGLRVQTKASMKALYTEGSRSESHSQMKALVMAETFDEAAFRDLLESKSSKRIDAGVVKAKMKNGIWNVLNAEQQEKLASMMAKMHDRKGKRGFRGHGGN
jgi:protein CpxP